MLVARPNRFLDSRRRPAGRRRRRAGAVTVEMALVVPVFLAITVGAIESGRIYDTQNTLSIAAREGARYAAMDRSEAVAQGQASNAKIASDVVAYLTASGVNTDDIEVFIVDATDHTTPIDLDDPDNQLQLFELRIEMPLSGASHVAGSLGESSRLTAKVVFRNAPSTLVQ